MVSSWLLLHMALNPKPQNHHHHTVNSKKLEDPYPPYPKRYTQGNPSILEPRSNFLEFAVSHPIKKAALQSIEEFQAETKDGSGGSKFCGV